MSANQHTDNRNNDATHGHTTNTDTIADDIRDITAALVDTFRWITSFSLTDFLCRIMGHGFDPEGCLLPAWDYKPTAEGESRQILDVADIDGGEEVIGAFTVEPNGDMRYADAPIRKMEQMLELTDQEWEEMKDYDPPLLNRHLAKKLKYHWKNGASDREAGILAGCSVSYARHHRLAFQKAATKHHQ